MITLDTIIRVVADEFGVEYGSILSRRRTEKISRVRQYCYFAAETIWSGATITSISRCFGRDHTTILYGIKKAKRNLKNNQSDFEKMQILFEAIVEHIGEIKSQHITGKNSFGSLTTPTLCH